LSPRGLRPDLRWLLPADWAAIGEPINSWCPEHKHFLLKHILQESIEPKKRRTKDEIAADLHEHQVAYGETFGSVVPIHVARHAYLVALDKLELSKVEAEVHQMVAEMTKRIKERHEALKAEVKVALDKLEKKKTCRKCHGTGTITSKKTGTTVDCDCVRRA
jgi:hypothetical protein